MFHRLRFDKYSAISDPEDAEILISETLSSGTRRITPQHGPGPSPWTTVVLLVIYVFIYFVGFGMGRRHPSDLGVTQHVSKYCKSVADRRSGQELTAQLASPDTGGS